LAVAFILRIIGIFYGFPLALGSDESPTLLAGLKMLGTHSLVINATGYYYPPVLAYLYLPFLALAMLAGFLAGVFSNISELKELVILNYHAFIPLARLFSVIMGTASVYLVYEIGRKLFNKRAGLIAASILAVSLFHVGVSHFANTWATQTFFILLVLWWAVRFYKKTEIKTKDYLVGGFLIALAFGVNFVGIISYLWLLLVHYFKNRNQSLIKIFVENKNFWLATGILILIIILFYFLNPFGLNNYFNRITDTETEAVFGGEAVYNIFNQTTLVTLWFYLKNVFILQPILCLIFLFSALTLWKKEKALFWLLPAWCLMYLLLISPLSNPINRYALPMIAIMAIMAGFWLSTYSRKKGIALLLIIILIYNLCLSWLLVQRLTKNDTRQLTRNWIIKNIPDSTIIQNNNLNESLGLTEDRENIKFIEENFPEMMSTKRRYLLNLPDERYPVPSYFLIMYNFQNRSEIPTEPEYLIVSDYIKPEGDYPGYELVKNFYPENGSKAFGRNELLLPFSERSFSPWSLFHPLSNYGPYINIYKIDINHDG